jgi:large subunit ribosomal protein L2
MRSGEQRLIHNNCTATLGIVSNIYSNQIKLIKAGQNCLLGKKPIVRGIAMNPVDHPHGGRTNKGMAQKTP